MHLAGKSRISKTAPRDTHHNQHHLQSWHKDTTVQDGIYPVAPSPAPGKHKAEGKRRDKQRHARLWQIHQSAPAREFPAGLLSTCESAANLDPSSESHWTAAVLKASLVTSNCTCCLKPDISVLTAWMSHNSGTCLNTQRNHCFCTQNTRMHACTHTHRHTYAHPRKHAHIHTLISQPQSTLDN